MPTIDSRIDAYIHKTASFAYPILEYIRNTVHVVCPEVVETIKWGFPHFEYRKSILCSMAAFRSHCAFGFWLGSMMPDRHGYLHTGKGKTSTGNLGRITQKEDLPIEPIFREYILDAMQLIEKGVKLPAKPKSQVTNLVIPEYFILELKQDAAVFDKFQSLSNSHKKEYIDWIDDAKTEATRQKRMATAIEWIGVGKSRNWKYER